MKTQKTQTRRTKKTGTSRKMISADVHKNLPQELIPDLEILCRNLQQAIKAEQNPRATAFFQAFLNFDITDPVILAQLKSHEVTNHVLVRNAHMKVVLIHWPAGKISSIHGHAKRGCAFKLLQGELIEKRYTTDPQPQLQSVTQMQPGAMAYIDDVMGYHAVGNEGPESAISIHAYTPGL